MLSPHEKFRSILLTVEKPGRYAGGEYGIAPVNNDAAISAAISYPDLYELGMSNLAIQILYRNLNALEGVSCERVFAPAQDFGQALTNAGMSLSSLESGKPLKDFDILGFSMGYELIITNVLYMLTLSRIPLKAAERGEGDPIVIAGGPAVTNPLPFSAFFDGIFIGEAEDELSAIFKRLVELKKGGAGRADLLREFQSNSHVYFRGKAGKTERCVWQCFGQVDDMKAAIFPVPNIKTVQDHGIVEIMRGCPNGCRFCQAGFAYRPVREKQANIILDETENLVTRAGYTEITLASLSTGDYSRIQELLRELNARYSNLSVSFSLPSLKISSFLLPLLKEVKVVRKTGLTFAVETPDEQWQLSLNKNAEREKMVNILSLAKSLGWKNAKFYFMVGLPPSLKSDEEQAIVNLMRDLNAAVPLNYSVNVGTFVPKPHTPFQWAPMLSGEEALRKFSYIKKNLSKRFFKVSYHETFQSFLEAMIARGDERMSGVIEKAFKAGAVMDAWEEHLRKDAWLGAIDSADWGIREATINSRSSDEVLPWSDIDMHVSGKYLAKELGRSETSQTTGICAVECNHNCGSCIEPLSVTLANPLPSEANDSIGYRGIFAEEPTKLLVSFEKKGKAAFLSHLNLVCIFERSVIRAGYAPAYTEGFNPQPRFEFAQPLSLGFESEGEICSLEVKGFSDGFLEKCNRALPEGLRLNRLGVIPKPEVRIKQPSLMSLYNGSLYGIRLSHAGELGGIANIKSDFEDYLKREGISAVSLSLEIDGSLSADIRHAGGFTTGLLKLLQAMTGKKDILAKGLMVTRKKMWAKGNAGTDYFSMLTGAPSDTLASFQ